MYGLIQPLTGACFSLERSLQLSVLREDDIGFSDQRIRVCEVNENRRLRTIAIRF